MSKLLPIGAFIVLIVLAFILGQQTEKQNSQVRIDQLQQGNAQQSREQAERVVREVRNLIVIAEDIEPTVATIVDVDTLKSRNPFYANAKNGDHLIVTNNRAILYDPEAKKIIDVVPVQLDAQTEQPAKPQAQLLEENEEGTPEETPEEEVQEKPERPSRPERQVRPIRRPPGPPPPTE